MAFDNSCTKPVLSASPGLTPKSYELPLFLNALEQAVRGRKAVDSRSLNMQFSRIGQKKQITALSVFT